MAGFNNPFSSIYIRLMGVKLRKKLSLRECPFVSEQKGQRWRLAMAVL